MSKPSLCIFLIVKNEERDLPRCLKSIAGIADAVAVIDTGSTDGTQRAIFDNVRVPLDYQRWTGASERDASGDWKLQDFAAARNYAITRAESIGTEFIMWMDADDELLEPAAVRRHLYRDDFDALNMFVEEGGTKWLHCRLWRTAAHIRFKGRVHEYPVIDGMRVKLCKTTIRHNAEPGIGQEDSNDRNLRLLLQEWADSPNARTAFYLGCTYKSAGKFSEAANWFQQRLNFGEGYLDEFLFAALYLSRSLAAAGDRAGARGAAEFGQARAPGWAEFIMQLARLAYDEKDYQAAIDTAAKAAGLPIEPTGLWREACDYRDQPARLTSWCFEHMGDLDAALTWANHAAELIGHPDIEWNARTERLQAALAARSEPSAPVRTSARPRIALVRPGAIGDILATLNLLPAFRVAHPEAEIVYFCAGQYAEPDALLPFILAAGADLVLGSANAQAWTRHFAQVFSLIGYQIDWPKNDRLPMDRHLLRYFEAELGIAPAAELPQLELAWPYRIARPGPYATIQVSAGWSKYKEWPLDRWQAVVDAFPGVPFFQIGEPSAPYLRGVDRAMVGRPLAESIGFIANADLHVGVDSFAGHVTHYKFRDRRSGELHQTPAVIVFGSTQPEVLGYPENVNLSAGLPCSAMCYRENPAISTMSRGPCVNPPRPTYEDATPWACMQAIEVEAVIQAIRCQAPALVG
jgi:ADP-heptose:LPS heptosyltransferase/glycosyltransferase involved in cell wall biosynthesis